MNHPIAIPFPKQSWMRAAVFLFAFCFLGLMAVRCRTLLHDGLGEDSPLPLAARFVVGYGPVAFPLLGIIAATAILLAEVFGRRKWLQWALIIAFIIVLSWGFIGTISFFTGLIVSSNGK
jgi:hypothetical protein